MIRTGIVAGFLGILLAGCTSDASHSEGEPDLGYIPAVSAWVNDGHLSRPRDAVYAGSNDEAGRLIWAAENMLVNECLERFGFHRKDPRSVLNSKSTHDGGEPFGITSESHVAKYGYRMPEKASRVNRNQLGARPSDEEIAIEMGDIRRTDTGVEVPTGGCLGEAHRRLYGDKDVSTDGAARMMAIMNEAAHRAESDSRVREVFRMWSTCMQESGYHYADPWEANDDPKWRGFDSSVGQPEQDEQVEGSGSGSEPEQVVTAEEIATAKADLTCRKKHNVVGVWYAVNVAYEKLAIEDNAQFIEEQQAAYQALVERANEVIGR